MPRILSITAVTLSLLAFALPIFAQNAEDPRAANLMARNNDNHLVKRRPNHADQYGYPHDRGHHPYVNGVIQPFPDAAENTPMTPGGYLDPRAANPGAECRHDYQCSTRVVNAEARCNAGVCGYACLGNTHYSSGVCTGSIVSRGCTHNSQCGRYAVRHGAGVCLGGKCTFECNSGFYAYGSGCDRVAATCGTSACPVISGGYTTCRDGECEPHCDSYLGYRMFCNTDKTVCTCTNVYNDPDNCGTPGNSCPFGYNGKGGRQCRDGKCSITCPGLTRFCPPGGTCYCD